MSRFYNLPSAWDPGYVIPRYVMAEPPQRGTMTTQWLPRGTIDAEVPEYTLGAGKKLLGRSDADLGSLSGSSLAGSCFAGNSLSGDTLGATSYQLEATGALPNGRASGSAPVITKYGQQTARGIIAQIKRLAPSARAGAMKSAMARIDKTLQARTENYARMAQAQGVPAGKCLEVGLARALSEGVVGELAKLGGRSSALPQPSSLLGLGLDRAQKRAQGAGNYVGLGDGYVPKPAGQPTSTISTSTVTPTVAPVVQTSIPPAAPGSKMVQVGPFLFPITNQPFAIMNTAAQWATIPGTWKRYIRSAIVMSSKDQTELAKDILKVAPTAAGSIATAAIASAMKMSTAPTNAVWNNWLQIKPGEKVSLRAISPAMTTGKWSDDDDGRAMPIAQFTHPVTGNKWGVFVALTPNKTSPTGAQLYVKWIPEKPWYSRALSWIVNLPAAIVDAVKEVVEWVGDQTCNLIAGNPNALPAAAAANPAAGAGMLIAQQICGQPTPPPMMAGGGSNMLLWIMLGGGGLLAAIALTRED